MPKLTRSQTQTSWLDPRLAPEADSTDVSTSNSFGENDEDEDASPLPTTTSNPQEVIARPLFRPVSESAARSVREMKTFADAGVATAPSAVIVP